MKNKRLNNIVLLIKSYLPMSRRKALDQWNKVVMDNSVLLRLYHAQTELALLNRHDIMTIASRVRGNEKKEPVKEPKTKNVDEMFG